MSRAISTSPFGGITLIDRVRQEGPFELWGASLGERTLAVRRVAPELRTIASIRKALAEATATAQKVAHENVVLCHGLLEKGGEDLQISERPTQVDLAQLGGPLEVRLATFIARQITDAIVHAASLGADHNNLMPRHVYGTLEGSIRVDFGAMRAARTGADQTAIAGLGDVAYVPAFVADGLPHPPHDLYAIACIWFELLTGKRYADLLRERRGVHPDASEMNLQCTPAIDGVLRRVLDGHATDPLIDPKTFASALARVYYVELDAHDDQHGHRALSSFVAHLAGVEMPSTGLRPMTNPEVVPPKGAFTLMLEERARPVQPKPLAPDDRDSEVVEDSTWSPGQSLSLRAKPGGGYDSNTDPAALPPRSISAASTPSGAVKMNAARAARPAYATWAKWFLFGFVLTLLGLQLARSFGAFTGDPAPLAAPEEKSPR